jgi:Immunity protein 44
MKFFISGELGFFPEEATRAFSSIIMEIQKKMDLLLSQNDYGNAVAQLGVIPTIYPQSMLDSQKKAGKEIKERKLLRKGEVDYRLFIDHAKFLAANDFDKKKMLERNVISVIQDLKHRITKDFDAERLESDIRKEFNI